MSRLALLAAFVMFVAAPGWTQVQVTALAPPDAFSTPGRETGLPAELWRGTPIELARSVLPVLAARPLSPAAAAVARRVLATGATGPEGAIGDEALVGARASALIALGDVGAAAKILQRQPGLDHDPDLARAAAESALLAGDNPRACTIAEGLGSGRENIYWMRLRAFCQAEAGKVGAAQLTVDLAQAKARDAVFGRLMAAKLGGTAPGPASLRGGLDYALSKALNLDLTAARPAPAVAGALSGAEPTAPSFDASALDAATPAGAISRLIAAAAEGVAAGADPKARARLQGAALLIAALTPELSGADRTALAGFAVPEGKGPVGRSLALDAAGEGRRMGEAALLALWISADAGAAGPGLGDRVRIVRALARAGLNAEARMFALEGLAGLK